MSRRGEAGVVGARSMGAEWGTRRGSRRRRVGVLLSCRVGECGDWVLGAGRISAWRPGGSCVEAEERRRVGLRRRDLEGSVACPARLCAPWTGSGG